MPRVNWETQADWDQWYDIGIRNPEHPLYPGRVGYGRDFAEMVTSPQILGELSEYEKRVDVLETLGIQPTDRILIAGCAFGFLIEILKERGYPNVYGVDSSSHIESNLGAVADGDSVIISDDITGVGRVKSALKKATGEDEFNWVISESVLESYEDNEITVITGSIATYMYNTEPASQAVHFVMDVIDIAYPDKSIDPAFNQKTLEEWNAMNPDQTWVSYSTWRVL